MTPAEAIDLAKRLGIWRDPINGDALAKFASAVLAERQAEIERLRADLTEMRDDWAATVRNKLNVEAERDALREAGRNVLTTRYHESRASAALTTAMDNFASGYAAEEKAFVAATIAASEAEKKLASMVFDDAIDAARKQP